MFARVDCEITFKHLDGGETKRHCCILPNHLACSEDPLSSLLYQVSVTVADLLITQNPRTQKARELLQQAVQKTNEYWEGIARA